MAKISKEQVKNIVETFRASDFFYVNHRKIRIDPENPFDEFRIFEGKSERDLSRAQAIIQILVSDYVSLFIHTNNDSDSIEGFIDSLLSTKAKEFVIYNLELFV